MYLIKHKAEIINGQKLKKNDVISIDKKWFIIREELALEDKLKLTKLRNGKSYTVHAIHSFGVVSNFRKIGYVIDEKWVENLDKDMEEEEEEEKIKKSDEKELNK